MLAQRDECGCDVFLCYNSPFKPIELLVFYPDVDMGRSSAYRRADFGHAGLGPVIQSRSLFLVIGLRVEDRRAVSREVRQNRLNPIESSVTQRRSLCPGLIGTMQKPYEG